MRFDEHEVRPSSPGGGGEEDDAAWIDRSGPTLNPRTLELLQQVKLLPDTAARCRFIDGLTQEDRAELFKGLGARDRQKYEQHLAATVGQEVRADRQRRLAEARAGRAASLGDALEVLLEIIDQLSGAQAGWIRRIDRTASEFKVYTTFTPRQSAVIWNIYRKNFPRR